MNITREFNNPKQWIKQLKQLFLDNLELMEKALLQGTPYPDLYESGTVYERENIGVEYWQDANQLIDNLAGDCEDLAAYRAAQYASIGIAAEPEIVKIKSGQYHAIVRMPNGSVEDPSRILIAKHGYHGRGARPGHGKRKAKWRARKRKNHSVAFVGLPAIIQKSPASACKPGYIYIPGHGRNEAEALGYAIQNTYTAQGLPSIPVGESGLYNPQGTAQALPQGQIPPDLLNTVMQNPELQKLAMTNPYTAAGFALLQNPMVQEGLKTGGKAAMKKLRKWF